MVDVKKFRALNAKQKALVAIAVLLDGHEAAIYLENDMQNGELLSRAAGDLSELPPDLRVPLLGTQLRRAIEAIDKSGK